MALKPLLAVALLSALALAGCSGGSDDGGPTATSSSSSSGSSTGPAPNRAPTAMLNASAVNGSAPLNVTFTLDGHDADKDPLNWTLEVAPGNATHGSSNGTALPANVTLSFAQGNYTVRLTVSDGLLNATATLNLTVGASNATATLEPLGHFEGSATVPCPACTARYGVCASLISGENEVQCYFFELPAGSPGRTAVVTSDAGPVSADFMDACDPTGAGLDYFVDEESPHEAEIPDGAACMVVYDSTNPGAAFTVDIV